MALNKFCCTFLHAPNFKFPTDMLSGCQRVRLDVILHEDEMQKIKTKQNKRTNTPPLAPLSEDSPSLISPTCQKYLKYKHENVALPPCLPLSLSLSVCRIQYVYIVFHALPRQTDRQTAKWAQSCKTLRMFAHWRCQEATCSMLMPRAPSAFVAAHTMPQSDK